MMNIRRIMLLASMYRQGVEIPMERMVTMDIRFQTFGPTIVDRFPSQIERFRIYFALTRAEFTLFRIFAD